MRTAPTTELHSPGAGRAPAAPARLPLRRALERADDDRLALAVSREGGGTAFELLYERFQRPLYGYCCAILGNREEARDALQEAMVNAYQALLSRRTELRFKPWIYSIARNACIDRIRQRNRFADEELTEQLLQAVPSAEAVSEQREEMRTLLADMTALSERQRSALLLREMSGFSHEEIAGVLEASPSKCKALISEARQALADRALGREMPCEELREAVEAHGRRVLHGRRLRAHVETCSVCGEFVAQRRERALALFMPLLPVLQSRDLLHRVLESGPAGEAAGGGLLAALSVAGAKKLAVAAAVATAVGGGASQLPRGGQPAEEHAPASRAGGAGGSGGGQGSARATHETSRGSAGGTGRRTASGRRPGSATGGVEAPASPAPGAVGDQTSGGSESGSTGTGPGGGVPDPDRVAGELNRTLERAREELEGTVEKTVEKAQPALPDPQKTVDTTLEQTADALEGKVEGAVEGVDPTAGQTLKGLGDAAGQVLEGGGGAAGQAGDKLARTLP